MSDEKTPDDFARLMIERERVAGKKVVPQTDGYSTRAWGAAMVFAAVATFWLYVYEPIQEAIGHTDRVSYFWKGVFFQPALFVVGWIFLISGRKALDFFGSKTRPMPMVFLLLVCAVLCIAYTEWFKYYLASLGYHMTSEKAFF
jgi:hypothetical protein